MKKSFFILGFMATTALVTNAKAVSCPDGTTLNTNCWSCGTNCTAYLSDITDSNGQDVKISGTNTTAQRLTVTGSGAMYNYNGDNAPWHSASTNVTDIDVSGVSSIGTFAFYNAFQWRPDLPNDYPNVQNVNIAGSVQSIGTGAFIALKQLENVNIDQNGQLQSIGEAAFFESSNLTNINIPSNVTSIGPEAFSGAGLTSLVLPDSLFAQGASGLDLLALSQSGITSLVCSPTALSACNDYLAHAQEYKMDANGNYIIENGTEAIQSFANNNDVTTATYRNYGNGYIYNGKFYDNLDTMAHGKYTPKRIYTVDEANMVSGKKNKVMIRYK